MTHPSRETSASEASGVTGKARVGRDVQAVLRRLRRGDIAVVDQVDMDRGHAEALLGRGVVAVVNASSFISGRYPNLGPHLLAEAGVTLVDDVGPDVFTRVRDGVRLRVDDGELIVNDVSVGSGRQLSSDELAIQMDSARTGLSAQLSSFTHNTTEFLRREQDLLLNGEGAPTVQVELASRPVVIVVRRFEYHEDLRGLRGYIREQRPALIGVDAGADALLAAGHRPDLVLVGEHGLARGGQAENAAEVSDEALHAAREVVLHTDRSGRAVGSDRLDRLGISAKTFPASGPSEDVAMLLADLAGASLIVSVGTHATLDEFLDRHRAGLASTFLTRLRVGPTLVDAKAVTQLYSGRVRLWHLLVILFAGIVALVLAIGATPVGQEWWTAVLAAFGDPNVLTERLPW